MRAFAAIPLVFLLISNILAQQIAPVDLTHPPIQASTSKNLPDGCTKLTPGIIADGWPELKDHLPFEITVEVVSVKDPNAILGSELEAEVRLRNSDSRPLQIPWSTNPNVIEDGQDPNAFEWDQGTFEFSLKDKTGHQVPITSLTGSLYGSKFSAGSELTLKPGENISALVKIRLESAYQMPILQLKNGEEQLLAKWSQTGRSRSVKNCAVGNAYFHYDEYYHQQNLGLTVHFSTGEPNTDKKLPE